MSYHKDFTEGSIWAIWASISLMAIIVEIHDDFYILLRSDGELIKSTYSIDHTSHLKIV